MATMGKVRKKQQSPTMSPQGNKQKEAVETFRPEVLVGIIKEIQTDLNRKRSVRKKLLIQLGIYLNKVSFLLEEDATLQFHVVEHLSEWKLLILETARLCMSLSHPPSEIHEVYNDFYDIGVYMEAIFVSVYTWCKNNNEVFGNYVVDLLNQLLELIEENTSQWLYSVMISPIVLHTFNAFLNADHKKLREDWCKSKSKLIQKLSMAIFDCGDFSCQYFLMSIISGWVKWSSPKHGPTLVNDVFSVVSSQERTQFLQNDDPGLGIRNFLNALNTSARGPKTVIPILCQYMFVGDVELKAPELVQNTEAEFWVDFSIPSGRMHVFYSLPSSSPLLTLSVCRHQVDSVCLNWVLNNGDDDDSLETSFPWDTQGSSVALRKHETIYFFHIELNRDFDAISKDVPSLIGMGYHSIYLAFQCGDLAQRILAEMGYNTHTCGTKNCKRPKSLIQMLSSESKLSYSQSWCPESQVFDLDKTPSAYSGRGSTTRETSPSSSITTPGHSFLESLSPTSSVELSRMTKKILGVKENRLESPFIRKPLVELLRPSPVLQTNDRFLRTPDLISLGQSKTPSTPGRSFSNSPFKTPEPKPPKKVDDERERTPGSEFCKDLARSPVTGISQSKQEEGFAGEIENRAVRNLSQEHPDLFEEDLNVSKNNYKKSPFQMGSNLTPSAKNIRKKGKLSRNNKKGETMIHSKFKPLQIIKTSRSTPAAKGTPVLIPRRTPTKSISPSPKTTIFECIASPGVHLIDSESQDYSQENHSIEELEKRLQKMLPTPTGVSPQGHPIETPGGEGFYVSVTSVSNEQSGDEHSVFEPTPAKENLSTFNSTFTEDPLPPSSRGKYTDLILSSPFTPKKRRKRILMSSVESDTDEDVIRSSSQKSDTHTLPSPGVSVICKPMKNVLNITSDEEDMDVEPSHVSPTVISPSAMFFSDDDSNDEPLSPAINQQQLKLSGHHPEDSESEDKITPPKPDPATSATSDEPISPVMNRQQLNGYIPKDPESEDKITRPKHDPAISVTPIQQITPVKRKRFTKKRSTPRILASPSHSQINSNNDSEVIWSSSESDQGSSPVLTCKSISKPSIPRKVPILQLPETPVANNRAVPVQKASLPSPISDVSTRVKRVFESSSSSDSFLQDSPKVPSIDKKKKIPCYHNAFQAERRKLLEKSQDPSYDVYDLWTSTEMDEFRKKLFPSVKTYPGKKNSKVDHTVAARKNRLNKKEKDNIKFFLQFEKKLLERNQRRSNIRPTSPFVEQDQEKGFFKRRRTSIFTRPSCGILKPGFLKQM